MSRRTRSALLTTVALLALPAAASAAPESADVLVERGVICGGTCIPATAPMHVGTAATFHVRPVNEGPDTAKATRLDIEVPEHAPIVYAPGCLFSGNRASCDLGDLAEVGPPPGFGERARSLYISVRPSQAGPVTLRAEIRSATDDPFPDNNVFTDTLEVPPAPIVPTPLPDTHVPPMPVPVPWPHVDVASTRAVVRSTGFSVSLTPSVDGLLQLSGGVKLGQALARRTPVKSKSLKVVAGRRTTVIVPMPAKSRRAVRAAMRSGRSVKLALTAVLTDGGGQRSTARRTLPVRR